MDGIKGEDIIAWLEKQKELTPNEEKQEGKDDVIWCINQAKRHAKNENEMGTCWQAEKWLEKQGQTFTKKDVDDAYLEGLCDAKKELEKQGEQKQDPCEGCNMKGCFICEDGDQWENISDVIKEE